MSDQGAIRRPHRAIAPVEPVRWGARLVRAPGVVYTEVAGTPVLVRVDDADLQPLPQAWAACWAALDGRPVGESLEVNPETIDPITSRNMIEVLRRLKAKRLVVDIGSLGSDDRSEALTGDPTTQSTAVPTDVALHGRLEQTANGPLLTLAAPPTFSERSEPDVGQDEVVIVHIEDADGSLNASVAGAALRVVFEVAPTGPPPESPEGAERCVLALASLLAALDDPSCLADTGVVDLLAALAEQTQPTQ